MRARMPLLVVGRREPTHSHTQTLPQLRPSPRPKPTQHCASLASRETRSLRVRSKLGASQTHKAIPSGAQLVLTRLSSPS